MPQSMLSTSSVHSTVRLPPVLPLTGAPAPAGFSPPPLESPPPQPVRTAPASASARNAAFSIRSILRFLPPATPPVNERRSPILTRARGIRDEKRCRRPQALLTGGEEG